jgi:hypothetical protein
MIFFCIYVNVQLVCGHIKYMLNNKFESDYVIHISLV